MTHLRSVLIADYAQSETHGILAKAFYFIHGFGEQSVIIFFVLSGYLVGGEVMRGLREGTFRWRVYLIRRLARLYAVYLAALLLGAIWDNAGLHFFNIHGLYTGAMDPFPVAGYNIAERLHPSTFIGNLLFCQNVLVPTFGSNGPLWSLANEAWYYLLFPLVAWPCFACCSWQQRTLCCGLLLFSALFLPREMLAGFVFWLLGLVPRFLSRRVLRASWLPPALFLSTLMLIRLRPPASAAFWPHVLLAAFLVLWLNTLDHLPSCTPPGRAHLHRFLAGFSYSLYVIHLPASLLVCAVIQTFFGVGLRMPLGSVALLLYGMALLLNLISAWAVAQLTERRTDRIREWLFAFLPGASKQIRPPAS